MARNLFGFEIKRKKENVESIVSFAPPVDDDGATVVTAGGAYGLSLIHI